VLFSFSRLLTTVEKVMMLQYMEYTHLQQQQQEQQQQQQEQQQPITFDHPG
jgi:hypothetical protein